MITISELMDVRGRRALITGATGHLGELIAATLAELGYNLILVDKPGASFIDLETRLVRSWGTNIISLSCDLEIQEERDELLSCVKSDGIGLDCLINNAAFVGSSNLDGWVTSFESQSLDTWRRAIEVNMTAVFHICQELAPELSASSDGNIINVSSIYGEYAPDFSIYDGTTMGNPAAYAASKGGLLQLSRWLSTAMAPKVRVNSISPGGIFRNQPKIFIDRYVAKTPLKRMATEDDFKGAFAYLATPLSKYVTGQTLRIDGGWGVW